MSTENRKTDDGNKEGGSLSHQTNFSPDLQLETIIPEFNVPSSF